MAQAHVARFALVQDPGHHRHPHAPLLQLIAVQLQTFAQAMLHGDIAGLFRQQVHHQDLEVIDGAAIINNQLHPLIATVDRAPNHQAGIDHQVVGQAGIGFRKHHGLTAATEVFELEHGHAVALAGGDLADFRHHRHDADPGLVGLLFQAAQAHGREQADRPAELLERMVGEIEAHQLLLQPQLLSWGVIGHRGRLRGRAGVARAASGGASCRTAEQVEEVALAAGPVLRPRGGPIEDQIQVGHQLGPVGLGFEAVEGTGMDQGFQGAAVEGLARDAIAEVGKGAEGAIGLAGADQVADGAIAQVAHRREAKEDALARGGEINAGGIHIR